MFLLKSALAGERLKISSQPKFILKGNCLKTKLRIVWSLKPTSGKKVIACVHAEVAFIFNCSIAATIYSFLFITDFICSTLILATKQLNYGINFFVSVINRNT